jgi:hypothetical protein
VNGRRETKSDLPKGFIYVILGERMGDVLDRYLASWLTKRWKTRSRRYETLMLKRLSFAWTVSKACRSFWSKHRPSE